MRLIAYSIDISLSIRTDVLKLETLFFTSLEGVLNIAINPDDDDQRCLFKHSHISSKLYLHTSRAWVTVSEGADGCFSSESLISDRRSISTGTSRRYTDPSEPLLSLKIFQTFWVKRKTSEVTLKGSIKL